MYSICLPTSSYDSYFVVPVALDLMQHGRTEVDQYVAALPDAGFYAVECVPAGKPAVYPCSRHTDCVGGHWYNWFPLGVSVVALPVIALMKLATAALSHFVPSLLPASTHPIILAFFSGDLIGGRVLAELWTASLLGAATVWVQYRILSRFLSSNQAMLLAIIFGFGTSEWSVGTRSLQQHGPSLLFLSISLYMLLRGLEEERWIARSALPLALAYIVRPANAISVAVISLFVAVHYRRQLLRYLAWALPVAIPFLAYNLYIRHSLLPWYFYNGGHFSWDELWAGLAMNFFSPARGLLIFTPAFVFSLAGIVLAWRWRWLFPLTPYLIAILMAHAIVICFWWAGQTYGPRYFTDMTHLLVLFLVPVVFAWKNLAQKWRPAVATAFGIVAIWGLLVHGHGATSNATQMWNITPVSVETHRSRIWDWTDPPFLRGLPGRPK